MEEIDVKQFFFESGAKWLRADFHLHTPKDGQFGCDFNQYIDRLKVEKVHVGLITNHNKFDKDEYKSLSKQALKDDIFLLPGVELSVKDGANGIHCLVAFNPEQWLPNGKHNEHFIDQFLTAAFEGIPNRENGNSTCNYHLTDLLKKLDEHQKNGRDSFIIMAHCERNKGFLKELDGGRICDLAKIELFREFVLGFQQYYGQEIQEQALRQWFEDENSIPAFVEGSDPKKLEEVGRPNNSGGVERKCFLKISDYTFEAIKFALSRKQERISGNIPLPRNAYVSRVSYECNEQSSLKKTSFFLNENMNNLIGSKGSGKSTILETIRFGLGLKSKNEEQDIDKKQRLVNYGLGSSGIVLLEVVSGGKTYRIRRSVDNSFFEVTENGRSLDIEASDLFARDPIYYGQKDLSEGNKGFNDRFLSDQVGSSKLKAVKDRIRTKVNDITDSANLLGKLKKSVEAKPDIVADIAKWNQKLRIFEERGIVEKLNREIEFDRDALKIQETINLTNQYYDDLSELVQRYQSGFESVLKYESKENKPFFEDFLKGFSEIKTKFNQVVQLLSLTSENDQYMDLIPLVSRQDQFLQIQKSFQEEFAKIKRELNEPDLNPDDYPKFKRNLETSKLKLGEIEKIEQRIKRGNDVINQYLNQLKALWKEEFDLIHTRAEELNQMEGNQLRFEYQFQADKKSFYDKISELCAGTNVRDTYFNEIANNYENGIEIFRDLFVDNSRLANILSGGNHLLNFRQRFDERLALFLTYQVPNVTKILLNEKELDNSFSLGEKASALISFLLSQANNDLIIIDQPEDDLDNQSLYENIIKSISKVKNKTQFIFATHNANIPVLGDCEQVIRCRFEDGTVTVNTGGIDHKQAQKDIISIMEGGDEAFKKRNEIYRIWKQ